MALFIFSTLVALSLLGAMGPWLFSGRSLTRSLGFSAPVVIALGVFQCVTISMQSAPPGDETALGALRLGAVVLNALVVWLVAVPIVDAACRRSSSVAVSMGAAFVAFLACGIVFAAGAVLFFTVTLFGCLVLCT